MLPKEIIKKIRHIEIYTAHLVNDIMAGEYHSVFKGRGMDFAEVREYQTGDDIRTIDWNVTARTGQPHVKQYVEERELTLMLLVDVSSSGEFGTVLQMKGEIAVELCALLAFSAIKNNDRVGLIIFTDKIEKFVPPKKGKKHVLRVIRELLYFTRLLNGNALPFLSPILWLKIIERPWRLPLKSMTSSLSPSLIHANWNCPMWVCCPFRMRKPVRKFWSILPIPR
jgi:uncharacterized protein (DUF58 family)